MSFSDIDDMKETITKMTSSLANNAPHWVVLVVVVGFFLFYMERSDQRRLEEASRGDLVATQRIETCHDVQERSISVMGEVRDAMIDHTSTVRDLSDEVRRIGEALDRRHNSVDRKLEKLNFIDTAFSDPCGELIEEDK